MKRIVPIIVTDDRTRRLIVEWTDLTAVAQHARGIVDVPPDDQLTRDLDEVTNSTLGALERQDEFEGGLGHDGLALRDMALRVRTAFGLDEEPTRGP